MKRIFIKVTVFLHLPLEHKNFKFVLILLLLLCLLSDEINKYIKCSDCTCSYTYIVLAINL